MLKPNVISVLQKKSVKVQPVLENDTSNNKPIHFGVYKIITRFCFDVGFRANQNFGLVITCNIERYPFFIFFATHNEKLLYQQITQSFINLWFIDTQIYCDQNIAKISIVHTINNWHASCTRNFQNPLASTYTSLIKISPKIGSLVGNSWTND